MDSLGERRLREVLEAAARIAAAPDLPTLRLTAVETFSALLGSDLTSYNEIVPGRPALVVADGAPPVAAEVELLGSLIHQNPLVAHFARTGDGSARRFSDFLGERELRRLALHRELYRHIGVNFQVAISTAAAGGAIVGVALSRADRDFDDAEVAALELLRPHLVAAHARLTEIEWLRRMLAALDAEGEGVAAALVDGEGTVLQSSPAAAELLGEEGMPEPVRAALREQATAPSPRPLTVACEHRGASLRVRIAPGGEDGQSVVSLSRPRAEAARHSALALGLSAREAAVLGLLVEGGSSAELAARLGISPRTVEKHLGNAYRKLEVGGRAEALARVLA